MQGSFSLLSADLPESIQHVYIEMSHEAPCITIITNKNVKKKKKKRESMLTLPAHEGPLWTMQLVWLGGAGPCSHPSRQEVDPSYPGLLHCHNSAGCPHLETCMGPSRTGYSPSLGPQCTFMAKL
jgi:hypothetical protein